MSGNVTEQGITADLEWMHRVGIGGMQMFDGDMGAPLYVDKPIIWMSPEWKSAFRHAAAEADRLHMEMSMAASGGWSETAGPWVKPEQGMKKYAWSETVVEGPGPFKGALPKPPATVGKFQDLAPAPPREMHPDVTLPGAHAQPAIPKQPPTPEIYDDAAVVAFPAPAEEVTASAQKPEITCSCGAIDGAALTDSSFAKVVQVPYSPDDHTAWVEYTYAEPQPVQAILFGAGAGVQFSGPAIPTGKNRSQRRRTHVAYAGGTARRARRWLGQLFGPHIFDRSCEGALLSTLFRRTATGSPTSATGGGGVAGARATHRSRIPVHASGESLGRQGEFRNLHADQQVR